MKTFVISIICCFYLNAAHTQAANWAWAKSGNNGSVDEGFAVAANPLTGEAFITGIFDSGYITFGSLTLTSPELPIFIVKYDTAGNVLWGQSAYTNFGYIMPYAIAADCYGNVYITGTCTGVALHFSNSALVDTNPGYGSGLGSYFIAKFDSSGHLLWSQIAADATGSGITCDNSGNVIVTGVYSNDPLSPGTIFGADTMPTGTRSNVFVVKYGSSGNVIWAKTSSAGLGSGWAVSANPAGNSNDFYLSGTISSSSLMFDGAILTYPDSTPGGSAVFLAHCDSSGNLLWLNEIQGSVANSLSISASDSNSVYAAAFFYGPFVIFGNDTLYNIDTSTYAKAALVASYSSSGNLKWRKLFWGLSGPTTITISADKWNNFYLAAGDNGNLTQWDSFACTGYVCYVPTTDFGTEEPLFILQDDSNGNIICGSALNSGGDDLSGIAADPFGNAYITGDYYMNAMIVGADTLQLCQLCDGENIFIAKYTCGLQRCSQAPVTVQSPSTGICPGDSTQICAPAGFVSYQWSNGQTGQCIETGIAGAYHVNVIDHTGCPATSNDVRVNVYTPPPVSISVNGDTLNGYNAASYQWYLNNHLITGATSQTYIASQSGSYSLAVTDSNGCVTYSSPVLVSGIADMAWNDFADIYPNPLKSGNWKLQVDAGLLGSSCEIFDAAGRLIYSFKVKEVKMEIGFTAAAGVYLLHVHSPTGNLVKKLVRL